MDDLILVNKKHPLPKGYCPRLAEAEKGKFLEENAAEAYRKMKISAAAQGINIKLISGHRSENYQRGLIKAQELKFEAAGMDFVRAVRETFRSIAPPRKSEHSTGLAADIVRLQDDDVYESFALTPEYLWLIENAHVFGFILRYPKGGENITGYIFEPWHYRYVGSAAADIRNSGKTLEEYLTYL